MAGRPTWGEVRRFCERQRFAQSHTHHDYYEREVAPGFTAKTRISHGKDADLVPVQLWKRVWHAQLRLHTEDDFWRGLNGEPFDYDVPATLLPPEPLPAYLRRHLLEDRHLSDDEATQMSHDEAQRLFNEWCSRDVNG